MQFWIRGLLLRLSDRPLRFPAEEIGCSREGLGCLGCTDKEEWRDRLFDVFVLELEIGLDVELVVLQEGENNREEDG